VKKFHFHRIAAPAMRDGTNILRFYPTINFADSYSPRFTRTALCIKFPAKKKRRPAKAAHPNSEN
jgi:hypothetical protein